MNTGIIFLAVMAIVALTDGIMALRFRQLADRKDAGDPDVSEIDSAGLRRLAMIMLVFAPVLFPGAVIVSFGMFPITGIDPIKF